MIIIVFVISVIKKLFILSHPRFVYNNIIMITAYFSVLDNNN